MKAWALFCVVLLYVRDGFRNRRVVFSYDRDGAGFAPATGYYRNVNVGSYHEYPVTGAGKVT